MKGRIYWYFLADPATDGALIASLAERGLQVQNPATGRVTLIGPEGDQKDTTPDGLVVSRTCSPVDPALPLRGTGWSTSMPSGTVTA
jgi:hypothetical protein